MSALSIAELLPLLRPHLPLLTASTVLFFVVDAATPLVCKQLFPRKWNQYDGKVRRDWGMKVTSMVHACLILPLAIHVLDKPSLLKNPVFGYDKQVSDVLAISCGYFIWDTIASYLHSSLGFVVHGAACLAVYLFSFRPFLASFGPRFLLWELSTPFLNIHWFLEKLDLDQRYPALAKLNDIAFVVAFFFARIIFGGYHSFQFFQAIIADRRRIPTYLFAIYAVGNIALNILNWQWFSKILLRLVKGDSSKRSKGKKMVNGSASSKRTQ